MCVLLLAAERLGELDEPIGRVGAAVEQHVLDALEQVGGNLLVDLQLAGVDDAHVEASADGVIEEGRVHRLAHHLELRAAEGERDIADAAGRFRLGEQSVSARAPPRRTRRA